MILRIINFIILLLLSNSLLDAQSVNLNSVLKFYTFQDIIIDLQKYRNENITLNIYKCIRINIREFVLNRNVNMENISRKSIYKFTGKVETDKLNLQGMDVGFYIIEIEDNKTKEYNGLIITKNRFIYKQYGNNIFLWAVNAKSGEPIKRFEIFLNSQKVKQRKDYTYELGLNDGKNSIILDDENSPDFIYVEPKNNEVINKPCVKIFPKKKHYLLRDKLEFLVILREKIEEQEYQAPAMADIKILIFDQKNKVVLKEVVSGISKGIYQFSQILDERFNNGSYRVVVYWQNNRDEFRFIILGDYDDFYIFKLSSDKRVYFHNQRIKIKAEIYNSDGTYAQYGMVRYEILAKKTGEQNYKLYKVIKKYCKNGESEIKFFPNFLSKKYNYDIKIFLKYRGNNGIVEGDYITLRLIKSDFTVVLNSEKNIYESDHPVYIDYKIIPLNLGTKIEKSEFIIYRIKSLDKRGEAVTVSRKEIKVKSEGTIKIIQDKPGFYKALLKLKSDSGNETFAATYFYIISYNYGLGKTKSINEISLIPDKDNYTYGDIGKIFMILPYNNLWVYITAEREKVFSFSSFFVEKKYLIYDFPIYEKYSPNIFFNVAFIYKGRLISRKIKLQVPLITKRMEIKIEQSSDRATSEYTNKISFLTYNVWGHKIDSDVVVNTLSKKYVELYNLNFFDMFKYLYPEKDDTVITMGDNNIQNRHIANNVLSDKPFGLWDFVNTPYIKDASIDYKLIATSEEQTNIKLKYPAHNNKWLTYFYGFTPDTKIGKNVIEHRVDESDEVKYFMPKFLNVRDEVYINAGIFNYKEFPVKMKFLFNIVNGKFVSKFSRDIEVLSNQFNEFRMLLHLKDAKTTKIHIGRTSPFKKAEDEFLIPVVSYKIMPKKKNGFLRAKKKFYWLKYYENENGYYSKLKSTLFWWGRLHKNKDIMVVIELKSKKDYRNLIFNDFLPAGCKFIPMENYKYHITDITPDLNYGIISELGRIKIHIPYLPKGKRHIYYIIKPYLTGIFYIPGIYIENNGNIIYSTGKEKKVRIVK